MNSPKLKIGVIGLGWVANNRHIPVIMKNPQLHLYGVADKNTDRIDRLSVKYPWIKSSLSQDGDIPWLNEVDAVVIATDPLNHFHLAKRMLLSGKNVLLEKPQTMSPSESKELKQITEETGLICSIMHNFQFSRSGIKLKEMISSGQLGEIQSIEAVQLSNPNRRLPVWYEQLPLGLFYDESPHMFYMLQYLSNNEPSHLSSTIIKNKERNTPASVTAHYSSNGIPIRLSMNFMAALSEWHIAVLGSNGVGIIDMFRDILVTMPNDGAHRAREITASTGSFIGTHLWGFLKSGTLLMQKKLFYGADVVWDKFIKSIQENKHVNGISIYDGLKVVEFQHELMQKSSTFELP